MLKKNEEKVKANVDSLDKQVLHEAFDLSADLGEEEQAGSEGHKGLDIPLVKPKRVYTRRKYNSTSTRRSIRLQLNSKS